MLPFLRTESTVTFFGGAEQWSVMRGHPNFNQICELLESGEDDIERLAGLVDLVRGAMARCNGHATMVDGVIHIRGVASILSTGLMQQPDGLVALCAAVGDRVAISGDEDVADGEYEVGAVDDDDVFRRLYVEDPDGSFGYVRDFCVMEIVG